MKKLYTILFFIFIVSLQGISQPIVNNLYPGSGGTDVALDSVISIVFDRKVEPLINGGEFIYLIRTSDSVSVQSFQFTTSEITSDVTFSGDSLTLSFQANSLVDQETYSIIIADTVIREKEVAMDTFPGYQLKTDWSFTTGDFTGPVIQTLYPSDESISITTDSTLVIKFNETVFASDDGAIHLVYTNDTSTVFQSIPIASVDFSNGDSVIISANTFLEDSSYSVIIPDSVIEDASGNFFSGLNTLDDWNFTIGDFTAPTVQTLYPGDGSIDITTDSTLVIKFDETVFASNDGAIHIVYTNDTSSVFQSIPIAGVDFSNGDSVIITANTFLDDSTYSVIIPDSVIVDGSGNFFAGLNTLADWSFTIGDFTAPTYVNLYPGDGTTAITLDTTLAITFNEPVQKGTGNIQIVETGSPGNVIEDIDVTTGAVTVSGDSVLITHSGLLSDLTDYSILIPDGAIEDLSGNTFAGTIVGDWNFVTGDFTAPSISNLDIEIYRTDSINLFYQFDETGRLYYIISASSNFTTDSTDVRDATGGPLASGDTAVSSTSLESIFIDLVSAGLTNNTPYYIYLVSEDVSGNLSSVEQYSWTADNVSPVLSNTAASAYSNTGVIIDYESDENGTLYYAVYASWSGVDSLDIINGTGTAPLESGNFVLPSINTIETDTLTGFSPLADTEYYIYFTIEDTARNLSIVDSLAWTADGTSPVIDQITIFDTDNDGFIDSLLLDFSENILTVSGLAPALDTEFSLEMPDDSLASSATISNPNGLTDSVMVYDIVGQKVPRTDAGFIYLYNLAGNWKDLAGNIMVDDNYNSSIVADSAAPVITDVFIPLDNSYLDVSFSEGIYNSVGSAVSGTIEVEFTMDSVLDADVSDINVTGITLPNGNPPIAGADTLRFALQVIGNPSGNETVEISVFDGASIFDFYNNASYDTISTGPIELFDSNSRVVKTGTTLNSISSLRNADPGNTDVGVVFEFDITNITSSDIELTDVIFEKGPLNTVSDWSALITGARFEDAGSNDNVTIPDDGGTIAADYIHFINIPNGNNDLGEIKKNNVTKTFQLKVWFDPDFADSVSLDDLVLQFEVSGNDMSYKAGSSILLSTDSTNSEAVDIEVLATELQVLETQPVQFSRSSVNTITVVGTDINGNFDLGYTNATPVTVSGTGLKTDATLTGGPTVSFVNDTALFDDLNIDSLGIQTITFSHPDLTDIEVTVDVVDISGPAIVTTVPAKAATNVALTDTLIMDLDEDVFIETGKIYLVRDAVPPSVIEIDVTDADQVWVSNDSLFIAPTDPLVGSSNYYVLADTAIISDELGNLFDGILSDTVWYFTTTSSDLVPPSLTITRNAPSVGTVDATNVDSVTFALKFNEQINLASFTTADINVNVTGTLSASGGPTIISSGDKKNFTVTVSQITGDGYLDITVGPNVTDLAGNLMSATTSPAFKIDRVAPLADSVSISSNNVLYDSLATTSNTVSLFMRFNEPIGALPSVSFRSGGVSVVNAANVVQAGTDSTFTATYNVSSSDVQGEVTFSITFADSATNQSVHTTTTDGTVMYMDRTVPSVTLSTSEPSTTGTDPFEILATFSEGIIGADVETSDFVVTTLNAVISGVVPVAATSNQFTVTVDPADSITTAQTLSVQMTAATVRDSVGLNNTASNVLTLTFDDIAPVITDTVLALTTSSIKIIDTLDQAGKIYYVLLPNGTTAPDSTEVKAGLDGDAGPASIKGSTSTGTVFDFNLAGLSSTTSYDLYQVAEDGVGNLSSVSAVIDVRTVPGVPTLDEIATGTVGASGGDTKTDVAMYRTARLPNAFAPNAPSTMTPVTIKPVFDGDSIIIYTDADLTQVAYKSIVAFSSTGVSPTLGDFFLSNAFVDFSDANDDNGIYTFYITQKSNGATSGQSAAVKYSIAFLDDIGSSAGTGITVYSNDDEEGTILGVGNHPSTDQEVTFSGDGISGFDYNYNVGDTSYVNFIPADADPGPVQITVRWFNSVSNVSATFIPTQLNFTVNAVSSVFATAGAQPFCKADATFNLDLNDDPDGVDTLGNDTGNPDFHIVEVYYQRNGNVNTSIGIKGKFTNDGLGNIADKVLTYNGGLVSNLNADFGNPHSTRLWDFDPSTLDTIAGLSRQDVDTLIFVTVVSADADSSFTVLGTERVYLFPDPTVSITNVNAYYCNDDGSFTIETSRKSYADGPVTSGTISNGYILEYFDGDSYMGIPDATFDFRGISNVFDPSDVDHNALTTDSTGLYRIIYETQPTSTGGCVGYDTVNFELLPKPDMPEVDETAYTSIGTLSGGEYLFEYCGGDDILDVTILTPITGNEDTQIDTVLWYLDAAGDDLASPENISGTRGETLSVIDEFFGGLIPSQRRTRNLWVSVITNKGIEAGYVGCESDLRPITIEVYPEPSSLVVEDVVDPYNADTTNTTNLEAYTFSSDEDTISGTAFIYEYCVDGGANATLVDLVINSGLNSTSTDESYFRVYDKALNTIDTFGVADLSGGVFDGDLTFNPSGFVTLAAGQTDTFYISRTDYDNNYPLAFDDSVAAFSGCESPLTMFTISVYDIPDAPLASAFKGGENSSSRQAVGTAGADTIRYYFCFGDGSDFAQIESPGLTGSVYSWYTDNADAPDAPIEAEAFNDRFISIDELVSGGGLDTTNAGTTTFWVTETRNASNSTDFEGCESPATRVEVTVFPDPNPVLIDDGMGGDQYYSVSACIDDIASTSITGIGLTNSTFKWYLSNEDSTLASTSAVFTQLYTNKSSIVLGTSTVTGANLQLSTINKDSVVYFRVSQINNIVANGSNFAGCESELEDMGYLTFNIFDIPARPKTKEGDTTIYSLNHVASDSISIVVEGNANQKVTWYSDFDNDGFPDGGTFVHEDLTDGDGDTISTVGLSQLGLANQNGNAVYKFFVSQTQDIDGGDVALFDGCESPYLTVYIVENPPAPTLVSVDTLCAMDVVAGDLAQIGFQGVNLQPGISDYSFNGTTYFNLYNENREFVAPTPNILSPDGENFYEVDISAFVIDESFVGDTTIYLTQVNYDNVTIGSETFQGAEGDTLEYTIFVYPQPSVPITIGNEGANTLIVQDVYEYCEGLVPTTETLDVVGGGNPGAIYKWYTSLSNAQAGSNAIDTTASLSLAFINQNNDFLLTGGAFDLSANIENTKDFRIYVTETNSQIGGFVGCESEPKEVLIRVNPLPESTTALKQLGENFFETNYCYDDDPITIDASSVINGSTITSVQEYLADNSSTYASATYSLVGGGYAGLLVDNGDGTATLDPGNGISSGRLGDLTPHTIQFTFASANGCEITIEKTINIYPQPDISFQISESNAADAPVLLGPSLGGLEDDFYISALGSSVVLQGWDRDAAAKFATGNFASDYVAQGEPSNGVGTTSSGVATFDPNGTDGSGAKEDEFAPAKTFEISYTANGPNACANTITKNITVLPVPEFVNFDEGEGTERKVRVVQACLTQEIRLEVAIGNLENLELSGLTIDDISFSVFATTLGQTTDTLILNDVAQNGYGINMFKSDSIYRIEFQNAVDELLETPGYPNLGAATDFLFYASYTFNADHGDVLCVSQSGAERVNLGNTPAPLMRWDSTTVGSNTIIYFSDAFGGETNLDDLLFNVVNGQDNTDTLFQEYRNVESLDWSPSNIRDSLVLSAENFQFPAGTHQLVLEYNTESECKSQETRYITINDLITVANGGEELEDFESGSGGWYVNDINYISTNAGYVTLDDSVADVRLEQSWELGTTADFGDLNTSTFWVTDADSSYLTEEESWVMSPTYDLSAVALPTISFSYASYLDPKDGVVLQYSTDDGVSWAAIGSYTIAEGTSGKNWYNREGINGSPGNLDDIFLPGNNIFNPQVYGWSFAGGRVGSEDENEVKWRVAAHKLDAIGEELAHIRFRFALGASTGQKTDNSGKAYAGFAFDNFKLYDREKLIVVEQFTSLASAKSLLVADELNNRVAGSLGNDALVINYFTSLVSEPDPLNLRSASAASARTLYYGIEQVPKSVISGQIQQGTASSSDPTTVMGWNVNKFNEIALDESAFNIGEIVIGGSDQEVTISTSFESKVALPDSTEVSFRFAIVEDSIVGQEVNTTYGVDLINNALRAMLPSSGGLTYVGPVAVGQTDFGLDFNLTWNISKVYDPSKLAVIIFVQLDTEVDDEAGLGRGVILQAKRVEVPDGKIVPDASNITATTPPKGKEFNVYPNPSDAQFEIEINGYVKEEMNWRLYDQTGREVSAGVIRKGQTKISVDTDSLPSGLYMLRLFNRDINWDPKRVMILH